MSVLPGDVVPESKRYGPGIENRQALVAGYLEQRNNIPFIDNNFSRYTPAQKDLVIGTIMQQESGGYAVSLQPYGIPVRLNQLAFENATKKNKPDLQEGDVVYARVSFTHRDLDTEIECYDSKTGKAAGFGQLKGGNIINIGLGYARRLLFDGHPVLEELGAKYVYELAIGVNGKVWVKGQDLKTTLAVCQRIQDCESQI